MSVSVIAFPRSPGLRVHRCVSCGSHFEPKVAKHTLCYRCYRWHRVGLLLAEVRRLFEEEAR
jgi:hypothetical protein